MSKTDIETTKEKKKPYPYKILPFDLYIVKDTKALKRKSVLEFFRVEALLRSPKVHELYAMEDKRESSNMLFEEFGFGWEVLHGEHHRKLDQDANEKKTCPFTDPVYDIKEEILKHPDEKEERAESWKQEILSCSSDGIDERMIFQIDVAFPPGTIIKMLRPLLEKAHDNYAKKPKIVCKCEVINNPNSTFIIGPAFSFSTGNKIMKLDLITWLQYFEPVK